MDYNVFKSHISQIKDLFQKIIKESKESDKILFHQKIVELEKYVNEGDNPDVYRKLIVEEFHRTLLEMLKVFIDTNEIVLFNYVSKFISSTTEYSEEFGEALVCEDIPELLIYVTIKCGNEDFISNFSDKSALNNIIYYILHITYHIIRHGRFQQCFLLNKNIDLFKQTILPWMSSKVVNTRILATFVLSWLMEENKDDKYVIEKHSDIIKNVCEYIKEGIRTHEKYYRGYSLWELLLGLQSLTSIDSLKIEIINVNGFISTLIIIINLETSTLKEIEAALGILWSLTFVEENRDILKKEYHIEDIAKKLSKSENDQIRRKAKGLLWELNKKQKCCENQKSLTYDVFMSYCHSEKEKVSMLVDILKKKFKVWIDTDNMKGSGLNDMANGIEQSTIFLMAVSNSYKQSQCCRSEANWAFKLNKPIIPLLMVYKYNPDGWLGMMISSETYIDFSNHSDFNETTNKIIQHISYKCTQIGEIKDNTSDILDESDEVGKKPLGALEKSTTLPHNVRDWDSNQVLQWLSLNKLSHLKSKFLDFDGGMLLAMKNMMDKTYEKYNNHLENKFKMSLTEILKFDSALSSLKI